MAGPATDLLEGRRDVVRKSRVEMGQENGIMLPEKAMSTERHSVFYESNVHRTGLMPPGKRGHRAPWASCFLQER